MSGPTWPLYPLEPAELYVNVGFWSTVAIEPGRADGDVNRQIEDQVHALDPKGRLLDLYAKAVGRR